MKSLTSTTRTTVRLAVCFALLLAVAVMANAQTFATATTTTTLFGGSLDTTTFGFSAYTAPFPGVILTGTAISTITGKPVRHLWYSDPLNGFCRIDPEVDAVVPVVGGFGGHNPAITSCFFTVQKGLSFGQVAFDSSTNTLYSEDTSRTNAGIIRFHYIPSGDSGQGAMDNIHVDSLLGGQAGINAFGGCPALKDPKTNALVPVVPNSAALGPDGNLYTGSIRDGAIIRILSPATFNPATQCPNPNKLNAPGDQIQIPILSADEQFGSGHTFGLGFIGTTLLGADNIAPWILLNATQCLTAINGNKICGAPALGGSAPGPTEFLTTQVAGPQAGLISDAVYPTLPGAVVYAATFPSVTRLTNILSPTSMTVNLNYGGTFSFITGMAVDPQDPNNATVYVGADPTQGGINGSGQIWQITSTPPPCTPGVPLTVLGVTAAAGNSQATVSWLPGASCQAISSYVVRTLLAGGAASGLADVTVLADPVTGITATQTTVVGLTNGASYQFEVQACNLIGCSPFSALSPVATLSVPGTPAGVTAVALDSAASVTWVPAPVVAGVPPTLSNTVSAFDSLAPTVVAASATVPVPTANAVVRGLINNHTYTFTVHATNAVGNSPESAPSLPLTLPATDMAILMSAPASVTPGAPLTFTMTVTNNGPINAPQVRIAALLGLPVLSFNVAQGVCQIAGTDLDCLLGPLNVGASTIVTATVTAPLAGTTVSSSASVTAENLAGAAIPDPNPANNTATVTVTTPPGATTTTDIQVTGAAQNGNPVHGTPDVFTWQIKNNLGTVSANGVAFTATTTAPTGAVLSVVSTNPGAGTTGPFCTINVAGTGVNCSLGTIAGGATAIVTVTAVPSAAAPANSYSMTGSATFSGTDTNPANNSFSVFIGAQ